MTDVSSLPYRPCVGLALFNDKGQVFVGERIDTPGAWQMPQGGIDAGEDIKQAAMRELKEEIGTDKAEILQIASQTIAYDLPPHLQKKLWQGRYRGQEQSWVALRFTGKDHEINLTAYDPPEFRNWQWIDLDKTLELVVPFKRMTYEKVIALFANIA